MLDKDGKLSRRGGGTWASDATQTTEDDGKENSSCGPLRPHTTPRLEEKSILGVIYGVLLWYGMNAATPLGARGRSVMSLGRGCVQGLRGGPMVWPGGVWFQNDKESG